MTTAATRFRPIPSIAIFPDSIPPTAKTMALGGVATGNMNAQDALIVAGIINISGANPAVVARAPRIGRRRAVVAVLLVISVKKETEIHITNNIGHLGKVATPCRADPMCVFNPDATKP